MGASRKAKPNCGSRPNLRVATAYREPLCKEKLMPSPSKFIKVSRPLTIFFLTALGVFWLVLWCYFNTKFETELSILPFIILMGLNLIGAFSGYKTTLPRMLCMILFTVLSLIAPYFLNIPFYLSSWFFVIYILLIIIQLAMLFAHLKK